MPIGPYPDFSTCVTAMQNKGHSQESAKNICGKMEQQAQANIAAAVALPTPPATPAVKSADINNKLYVKAFLLDDSLNINKWRVTRESIDKNINSFIGKPLVLTEEFDHPSPGDGQPESLNHWLAYQESYRVGSIIDITTKPNPVNNSTIYYAIIEVTDPDLKQSLRDNTVPLYVSPALAELVPNSIAASRQIPSAGGDIIANWTGVHLAIVSEPAFGVKKAIINEQCGGDQKACLLQLRKAHVDHHGVGKCGFCVKKALQKYRILQNLAQKLANDAASGNVTSQNTSHSSQTTQNMAGNYRKMSQLESTNDSLSTTLPAAQPPQQQQQQEHQQEVEKVERPNTIQNPTKMAVQPPQPTTLSELTQTVQNLRHENELLRMKNEELSNINGTIGERIAAIELERRREHIERIITPDIIRDDKARLEKIKYFVGTTIPLNEIEQLYKDIKVITRKASANLRAGGRVPYGISMGSSGVASAAQQQPSVTVDEETGMTPLQKQLAVLRGGP
jgi:hypothetical protein